MADVDLLGDFFHQDRDDKVALIEELLCEWAKFKYNLPGLQSQLPEEIARPKKMFCKSKTPTEWLLEHMLSMKSTSQHLCPCLLELGEMCLSLPVSNTWPKQGASGIKRLQTCLRSSIKNDMLEALMQITINGPSTSECQPLIQGVTKQWFAKTTQKLEHIEINSQNKKLI